MATVESPFHQTIAPVTHDLGAFKVHRTLPSRERTMVGPFIFVDEFGPARLPAGQGMDVRPHPHINLATVTYLFDGAIEHRDSIGSQQVIEPGAINLMTAGRGIVHSERSPDAIRAAGPSLYGMQTWLALPDGREEVEPAFDHVPGDGLPLVEYGGASARVLMGRLWGAEAATQPLADHLCRYPIGRRRLDPGRGRGRRARGNAGRWLGRARRAGAGTLRALRACPRPRGAAVGRRRRVMLMGGGAFTTPRHVYWNFVSSSKERLHQAKEDWKARRFPLVPGDEEEFIPFPEMVRTVSYP